MFFRKKEKVSEENSNNIAVETKKAKKQKPKKHSERLISVMDESVPESVANILRETPVCRLENGKFLIVVINTEDIGGLSKQMTKDLDKGQFIQCVKSCSVDVCATADLLENEMFGIIPTTTTLHTINEFSFLATFEKYRPAEVEILENGKLNISILDDKYVNFDFLLKLNDGTYNADMAIKDNVDTLSQNNSDFDMLSNIENTITEEKDNNTESVTVDNENIQSEEKPVEDSVENKEETINETTAEIPEEPVDDEYDQEDDEVFSELFDLDQTEGFVDDKEEQQILPKSRIECPNCHMMIYQDETCPRCGWSLYQQQYNEDNDIEDDSYDEITTSDVNGIIDRVLYAGDLDLKIDTAPFEARFISENDYVPIIEEREDTWINQYVTQLTINENSQLKLLHQKNIYLSRERYIDLLTQCCEDIANKVNVENKDSKFYELNNNILDYIKKKKDSMGDEIDKRRTDQKAVWEQECRELMDNAALSAKKSYYERNSRVHENILRKIGNDVADEIEAEYNKLIYELNEKRQSEAHKLYELNISQILFEIDKTYQDLLSEEDTARLDAIARINKYIDDHRKDQIAHEELKRIEITNHKEADIVKEEYKKQIEDIIANNQSNIDKLKQTIEAEKALHDNVKADYKEKLESAESRNTTLEKKLLDMTERFSTVQNDTRNEFEERINTITQDKLAAEEHLAHVDTVHNKYNKASVIAWAAIVAATFCIGTIFGANTIKTSTNGGHYTLTFTSPASTEEQSEDTNEQNDEVTEVDEEKIDDTAANK